jgi:alpha-beta hydrolase superfamily lysophospholipase
MRACVAAVLLLLLALAACSPRFVPPDPAQGRPALNSDHLRMADATALPLRVWRPDGPVRAVVLALHGFNDYSNAFDSPGRFWAGQGIQTYAYDQRGFGGAPFRGRWPTVRGLTGDLKTASRLIRARHPGKPLILLGESMGAAVVMAALAEPVPPAADGAILSAPAVWARETMPFWQRAGLWLFAHTVPGMKVSPRGIKRHPSDNIEMLRKLSRDPKVIKRTRVDAVYGLVNLMDAALAAAPKLPDRTLILLGKQEDIIPGEARATLRGRLSRDPCRVRLAQYDSGYHMLLRDLKAERVLRDVIAWVDDSRAALPSGAERMLAAAPAEAGALARAEAGNGNGNGIKEGDGAKLSLALNCPASRLTARP